MNQFAEKSGEEKFDKKDQPLVIHISFRKENYNLKVKHKVYASIS